MNKINNFLFHLIFALPLLIFGVIFIWLIGFINKDGYTNILNDTTESINRNNF